MANMTNEEAKDILISNRMIGDFQLRDAIDVAVKALSQEKNEDCISRNEALSIFKPRGITDEVWEECDVYKKLTALPPVLSKQKWIPVSEKLPEINKYVLAFSNSHHYIVAWYNNGQWNSGLDENIEVEAWLDAIPNYERQ